MKGLAVDAANNSGDNALIAASERSAIQHPQIAFG